MSPSRTDLESWHRHHCIGRSVSDSVFVPIRTFPNHLLDSTSSESVEMSESSESELESLVSASCNISGSSNSISPTSAEMSESSESESVVNFGNQTFFEGVEKLLEVWFTKKSGDTTGCDLRKISRFKNNVADILNHYFFEEKGGPQYSQGFISILINIKTTVQSLHLA